MTQTSPDPSVEWAAQLSRLDQSRRDAVIAALRRSASAGRPVTRDAVQLLVDYALGEITSRDYVAGILRAWDTTDHQQVAHAPVSVSPPVAEQPPAPIGREQAVHAYVTGQIDVAEFLRVTRS